MEDSNNFLIKIIGIGDYGISIINSLSNFHSKNIECIEMNTDWAFLNKSSYKFIKLGTKTTKGLGTGALFNVGENAAIENKNDILNIIKDCNLLIIVAGLGGGTGSGVSHIVAKIAKELNIPTIAFVSLPPNLEGKIRCNNAKLSIENLKKVVNILIILPMEQFIIENYVNQSSNSLNIIYKQIDKIILDNISNVINLINSKTSKGKPIQEILKQIEIIKIQYSDIFNIN